MPFSGIEERYWWYRVEVRDALSGWRQACGFRRVAPLGYRAPQLGALRFAGVHYRLALAGVRFREFRELVQNYFGTAGVLAIREGTVGLMLMGEALEAEPREHPRVKVGPGFRVRVPTDWEWLGRTMIEDRAAGGPLTNLQRWEHIGDFAVALYDVLSRKIPGKYSLRAFEEGRIATTYNKRAARLTARVLNRMFCATNRQPFSSAAIASRLQARSRRALPR